MPTDDGQRTTLSGANGASLAHAALLATLGAFLWESLHNTAQIDDAYISYRYANNLVSGHGLVFNEGQYVEGITNLLWTLMVAVGVALGQSAPTVGRWLGFVFGSATLIATHLYARRILEDRALVAAAPALLYVSIPFVSWSTCGMETPLFTWAITASLISASRGRFGLASASAIVATLTRPEGVLLAAAIFLVWLVDAREREWRGWQWPALYAAALLGLTGFRIFYYGSVVPNTFYAKVGGLPAERGLLYVGHFLISGAGLLVPMAALAAVRDGRLRSARLLLALFFVYMVCVGGDVFGDSRFLVPVMPALAVMGLRGTELAFVQQRWLGVASAALVLLALWFQPIGLLHWWVPIPLLALAALSVLRARGAWTAVLAGVSIAMVIAVPLAITRDAPLGGRFAPLARAKKLEESRTYYAQVEYNAARRAKAIGRLRERPAMIAVAGLGLLGYRVDIPMTDIFGLVDDTIARSDSKPKGEALIYPGHQRSNADAVLLWRHPVFVSNYVWDDDIRGYRRRGFLPERNPGS